MIMKKNLPKAVLGVMLLLYVIPLNAQNIGGVMTLDEAIRIARENSPQAMVSRLSFMSQYWNFRSYKAQFLPSLNLNGGVGQYNRSLVEVRDPDTGEISYVSNNTLTNDLLLSINQQIALTGGTISVNSSLNRLDQFDYDNVIYNSNPITINYTQPLRAFNSLKWQKKSEPLRYEKSKKEYLEMMESITITATSYFFSVLSAQTNYRKSVETFEDKKKMYGIAEKRFGIGSITKSELLQLELGVMNAELAVSNSSTNLEVAQFNLKSFLGIPDGRIIELAPPSNTPEIVLDYDFVLDKALNNSSHNLSQEIKGIDVERTLAEAKANRGISINFNANLGYSQSGNTFSSAYSSLIDREVVGVTFSMPIYDWGTSRGRIKMAEAQAEITTSEIEQAEIEFRQNIRIKVLQFNNQARQCQISQRALLIADERYEITKQRFQNGGITVTELNTAQEELDSASEQYVSQLSAFWNSYYELQKLTLYDFIEKRDLSEDFDRLIDNEID